jgi:hypothetical protein
MLEAWGGKGCGGVRIDDPLYAPFIPPAHNSYRSFTAISAISLILEGACRYGRSDLPGLGRCAVHCLWSLCLAVEGALTMVALLYAIAALGVAIYMVAALTRPDKF